jgi:hypothetical protein
MVKTGVTESFKEFSWSLDISTTNVGMALWNEEGELVELKHLELNVDKSVPEEDRYIYKANLFKTYIKDFKERILKEYDAELTNIFVEAPLNNTPVNINTTAKLLGFNGIACYILYEVFKQPPYLISVYQSRKLTLLDIIKKTKKKNGEIKETLSFPKGIDKKHFIWERVSKLQPEVNWFYTKTGKLKNSSYDMSDAFLVGIAGLLVMEIIDLNSWKEKYYSVI